MEQERLERAYQKFGEIREELDASIAHELSLYPYAACEKERDTEFSYPFIWSQVSSDFCALINTFNAWRGRIRNWHAWSQVLPDYDEQDQWSLRIEFLSDVAFFCLMQPSGFVDRSLEALTTVLHHANLTLKAGYLDVLPADKKIYKRLENGHPSPYDLFESRTETRKLIQTLSEGWCSAATVLEQLDTLNDSDYQSATLDYRNRASHSFAPHLDLGIVPTVTRKPTFARKMVQRPDGRFDAVEDRSEPRISYGYGEIPTLSSSAALVENTKQLQIARNLLDAYEVLLGEVHMRLCAKNACPSNPVDEQQTNDKKRN